MDVVGVLILIDEDVPEVTGHGVGGGGIVEQIVDEALQVREVGTLGVDERTFVSAVCITDGDEERVAGSSELLGVDEFLGDLVEVATCTLDGCPAGLPPAKEAVVLPGPDDLFEALHDEEELRQFVERLVAVAERRAMAVLGEHPIAKTVDR